MTHRTARSRSLPRALQRSVCSHSGLDRGCREPIATEFKGSKGFPGVTSLSEKLSDSGPVGGCLRLHIKGQLVPRQ
jgi:hypothetical protein